MNHLENSFIHATSFTGTETISRVFLFFSFTHKLRQINFTFFSYLFIESDFLLLSMLWIIYLTRLWSLLNVGVLWKIEIIFPPQQELTNRIEISCYLMYVPEAIYILQLECSQQSTTSSKFSATCSVSNNSIYFPFILWCCYSGSIPLRAVSEFVDTVEHQFFERIPFYYFLSYSRMSKRDREKCLNENPPLDLTNCHIQSKIRCWIYGLAYHTKWYA